WPWAVSGRCWRGSSWAMPRFPLDRTIRPHPSADRSRRMQGDPPCFDLRTSAAPCRRSRRRWPSRRILYRRGADGSSLSASRALRIPTAVGGAVGKLRGQTLREYAYGGAPESLRITHLINCNVGAHGEGGRRLW